jgi:Na+/H+-dicarboxylate symporter
MDSGCVTLLITALFLSKVYGITITWEILLSLFISVYLLSVATPAVPGGILLCLPVLLPQIGIPASGITIIIGLYFIVSMIQTMTNVTSTTVCTYLVDRWEKADAAKK